MLKSLIGNLLVALICFVLAAPAKAEFLNAPIVCGEGVNALHGSLIIPTHKNKPPVILIVAGSGPTDRDGNNAMLSGKNDSLKMLAEELSIAGFATVRFDKRGVAASIAAAKTEEELRFQTYVADVESWVKLLSADPRFGSVAIIGHSEGATLGMLAAKRGNVAAYVSLAGPAQSAAKVLRQQLLGKLPPALVQVNDTILGSLEKGQTVKDVPPALLALYRPSVQPYLISWFPVVPADIISQLNIPIGIFQGDHDIQVAVSEALALAKAAPKARLFVVKGMNHILKNVPLDNSKQVASYSDPALLLDQEFLKQLVDFLKTHLVVKSS